METPPIERWLEPFREHVAQMGQQAEPEGVLRVACAVLVRAGALWAGGWRPGGERAAEAGIAGGPRTLPFFVRGSQRGSPDPECAEWARAAGITDLAAVTCGTKGVLVWGIGHPAPDAALAAAGVFAEITAAFLASAEARSAAEEAHAGLRDRLLHVQRLESLGLLASGVAHDFNNLLAVILGNGSLALLRLPADSPARAPLEDVLVSAQRAEDLTRQLLAYAGRGTSRVQTHDLSTQVRDIVGLIESTLPARVRLRLELADLPVPVLADVAQVQQVTMNLVMNAAEAVGDQVGQVTLSTGADVFDEAALGSILPGEGLAPGRYAWLEVTDSGVGMDAATRARIFDPFFTTKEMGRGLGLSAVAGILKALGGAVRVRSAPGRGTTLRVWMPAAGEVLGDRQADDGVFPRGEGVVLVVDDEAGVRLTARLMLEHLGYTVLEAADGREALDVVAAHGDQVRVVVLDLTMPVMDGEAVLVELRHSRPTLPVVLSSGYNELDTTRRMIDAGVHAFLQKPYTVQQMAQTIARVIAG